MKWFAILSVLFSYGVFAQPEDWPLECLEQKFHHSEFFALDFDERRSETGINQVLPVKNKIQDFVNSHPHINFTDINISASSSKAPLYINVGGRKLIDPQSDAKNMALAQDRARYASQVLKELKAASSLLSTVNVSASAVLAGPDFTPTDLNYRFVTKQSPEYGKQLKELYAELKEPLEKEALIKSEKEFMDDPRFSNLYQAKYEPFQGFIVSISGHKKCRESKTKAPSTNHQVKPQ